MNRDFVDGVQSLLGLTLTPEQIASFESYAHELIVWNNKFNLTAITDPGEIQVKHFLDSLTVLAAMQAMGATDRPPAVVDVGSGAGFPGLALRLLQPHMQLTLVESVGKKCDFLRHMAAMLGLTDVRVVHARAEELGQHRDHREHYDWALARAVAQLPVLLEYLLPLVRVGGYALAQKGKSAHDEVQQATHALAVLGGGEVAVQSLSLPALRGPRYLVRIKKVAATPPNYPRRPGMPNKRPLLA